MGPSPKSQSQNYSKFWDFWDGFWADTVPVGFRDIGMDKKHLILAYIDKMPDAISGASGHNATFAVARVLIRKFHLSPPAALPYMQHYNQRCQPPWSDAELKHKLASVASSH